MNSSDVIKRLQTELEMVQSLAQKNYSGTGVIVWDGRTELPIFPLSTTQPNFESKLLASMLLDLGCYDSPFHDGFHVLTKDFQLKNVGMYFAPPIIAEVTLDRSHGYGGRYVAGLFGSMLPGVLATGVFSLNYGVAIFVDGHSI